ncbi:MAG: hypothetical protein E7618_01820 [Ruminococcaceae bacterium]|nr:hypothetical protein [Oscillospiraceae bacterium]
MKDNKSKKIAALLILLVISIAMMAIGVVLVLDQGTGAPSSGTEDTTDMGNDRIDLSEYEAIVSDSIRAGDELAATKHGLALSGNVKQETMTAATGTLSETFKVWRFAGKGSSAEWTMNFGDGGSEELVMLEIEEVHESNIEAFGYTVYVDGKETYFRTYEQISSSPNHYFIAVKRSDLSNPSQVTVKIVSADDKPFAIANVWGYTDFFASLEKQGIDGSLRLYLHSAGSVDTAKGHIADFSAYEYDNYQLGLMFKVNYMVDTDKVLLADVVSFINVAAEHNMDLQLMPTLSWTAPYDVADGLGGFFSDVKYGQVLYNSLTGEWVDSTPNSYGNTQWCSWGNEVLLKAQLARIRSLWDGVTRYLYGFRSSGLYTGQVSTLLEHSVVYKGPLPQSKFYTMGTIDGGDFNPSVIAAAKADGITLDPTDGLSYEEKKWMNEYQARYVQALANEYNAAYGSDPILVNNGKVTYPTSLTSNNIFSHTVQWIDQTPSHGDLRISGWKSGIGTGFYEASEEFSAIDDIRFYQYRVAYGKTGFCNFEMSSLHDPAEFDLSFSKVYEAGVNFITFFNDSTEYGTAGMLKTLDEELNSRPATLPAHYDISLLNVDYNRDAAYNEALLSEAHGVVAYDNVSFNPSHGVIQLVNASKEGSITYRITDNGAAFENGIYFDLEAYLTGNSNIKVYVGKTADTSEYVGTFTYDRSQAHSFDKHSLQRFDITAQTKGESEYYVTLKIKAGGTSQATIKAMIAYRPFTNTTGQKNGVTFTVGDARKMNLWISAREEAERLLQGYVTKNKGENAVSNALGELISMGLHTEASQMASTETAKLLPITYAVTGEGQLGTLPISVKLRSETTSAVITIREISDTSVTFKLSSTYQFSSVARMATMTFTGLKPGSYHVVKTDEWNVFRLEPSTAADAKTTNEEGKVLFTVEAEYEQAMNVTELEGRVYKYGNGEIQLIVQDVSTSGYARYIAIPCGTKATFTRRMEGSEETTDKRPEGGDYVKLTFDEKGNLLTCDAVYGKKTGVIKSFTAPDSTDADTSNGLIEFEDGTVYELEYQAYTTSISFNGEKAYYARSMTTSDMIRVFKPGTEITITYCPEYYGDYQRILSVVG